ncbi:ABC transporter permease [Streptomyces anulatus]
MKGFRRRLDDCGRVRGHVRHHRAACSAASRSDHARGDARRHLPVRSAGRLVGWRISASPFEALAANLLILLFAFAMSWVGAAIGLMARSVEVAQQDGLIWLFPVTFVSAEFVSPHTVPGPLRAVAEWSPVSATATAFRELFGNAPLAGPPTSNAWPVVHALPYAAACAFLITSVFMLLALIPRRRLRRTDRPQLYAVKARPAASASAKARVASSARRRVARSMASRSP